MYLSGNKNKQVKKQIIFLYINVVVLLLCIQHVRFEFVFFSLFNAHIYIDYCLPENKNSKGRGVANNVMANVLDDGLEVSKFKLQ